MKKLIAALFAVLLMPVCTFAGSYETLAAKLVEAGNGLKGKKVVIIPFKTGNGLPDFAGSAAAHRLNVKLSQELFYDVATHREFVEADNWVAENGDQNRNSALQLMERLNAQLAITGEVRKKDDSTAEIKVKLINPSEKKTIATVSDEIPSEWGNPGIKVPTGNAEPAENAENNVSQETQPTPAYTPMQTYSQPASNYDRDFKKTASNDYMFLDLFFGIMNNTELNMEFKRENPRLRLNDYDVGLGGYVDNNTFELKWAKTNATGPIGLRFGFFADMIGFDFGLRYHSYETKSQRIETNLKEHPKVDLKNKYAKMSVYEMNGDLLLRFIKSRLADAYIGIGIGMSVMNVELPYVKNASGKATDEIGMGMSFRIPLGARWKVSDSIHVVTEVSYEAAMNMGDFNRNLTNEKDNYILSGTHAITGISFVF